jgi:uncharacterized iron-regulated membrane protein
MNTLYRRIWRWHFYAGLVCLPFLVSLAVTGALYLFRGGIEDLVYRDQLIAAPAPPGAPALRPRQLTDAALAAVPGEVRALVLPAGPGRNAEVDVATPAGLRQVFVDPLTGRYAGVIDADARLMTVIKHIHSLALAGDWAKYIIEAVAGWLLVLVSTGLYLWWPRGRSGGVLSVRATPGQRIWWRDMHAVCGLLASMVLAFLALTGMPWSVFWGANVNRALAEHGLGVPKTMWHAPRSAQPLAQLGDVPWTMRPEALPRSGAAGPGAAGPGAPGPGATGHEGHAGHEGMAGMDHSRHAMPISGDIGLDAAVARFAALGLRDDYRLSLPREAAGVYTAVRMPDAVAGQRVVHLDRYSGRVLADIGYADFGAVARVTEWGVSVHKGLEYGLANQLLLLLACLMLVFLAASGIVRWLRRRPPGSLAAPARRPDDGLAPGVIAITVALGLLFPVLGCSMLLALAIDYLIDIADGGKAAKMG